MSRSNLLSGIYFILALFGLFWSWSYFIQYFMAADSLHPGLFFSSVMQNAASSGVAIDAVIAAAGFSLMAVTCARSDGVKWPWMYVLVTFLVGLCVSLPMYLGFRERALAAGRN